MGYKANILTSLATKFVGSFITLGISIITARELGTEKLGEISLVVLAISISMLVSGILSGPPLIYFTPRKSIKHLLPPAYIANIISSITICGILAAFNLYNSEYMLYAILISILQSMFSTHFYVLLGLEKLMAYNFIGIIQAGVAIAGVGIMVYVFNIKEVRSYFIGQSISFFVGFVITIPFMRQKSFTDKKSSYSNAIRDIIGYGFIMQLASIFQQLNYRMSYYVIHWQLGDSKLGIFALTMQIAEGVLLISRSISVVLFSKIANLTGKADIVDKTNTTLKFTYICTFLLLMLMLLMPISFYELLFSKDFRETKIILWFISPGIMALSILTILSSYFGSADKVKVNAFGSFVGLLVIAITVWPLTMLMDLKGGAIANVISYSATLLVSFIFYVAVEKIPFKSMIINRKDFQRVFQFSKSKS
jgi:O-antigen/teichoic acid export membrane protein